MAIGRRTWAIPEGYIPAYSNGPAPELTSHDSLAILNAGDEEARVTIEVYYADREPVRYELTVAARRTHHCRLNDLTTPEAIPRGVEFSSVVRANVPVVVQYTRLDSRQAANALLSAMAYPVDD
jgi:hypothetical protein